MSTSPSNDDIVQALKKSGYLMEQEVATQFETLGFHVNTNWGFKDADEGKSREIDVRAIKRVAYNEKKCLSAYVEFLVECKNSLNPFVFIARQKNKVDNFNVPEELVFPVSKYEMSRKIDSSKSQTQLKEPFFHLGFDRVHYDFTRDYKAVQFCQLYRKEKRWLANHGGLYDAIFYPIAKAVTVQKKKISPKHTDKWRNFWFFIPIVVVSGEIYSVDSTQPDPRPQIANYLTFKREIRSGSLDGKFAIDFVHQEYLTDFFVNCVEPLILRMSLLTTNDADFVLKKDIPWA